MLEIKPIQDKNQQKMLCDLCKTVYRPSAMAYSAYDNGEPIGICQFRIKNDSGYLYDLCNTEGVDDLEALIIMGRATLNFIDLCGVHRAFFCGEGTDEGLLRAIGFAKNTEGAYEINLEGFFTDHCGNHKHE